MDTPILILGLGNPLRGDDGVGPQIVDLLNRQALPPGVTALDGGAGGIGLLHTLEGWERVVVVDAADVGRAPGEVVRFTPERVRLAEQAEGVSIHAAGLADALAMARALDRPLPPMVIFGVQPERIGWGEGLSPAVAAALPDLIQAILREVGGDNAQDSDNRR
ncbi:MAG: hydrogenase maturation protease [Anaerolineae bacterium]|nr:hydrogenase maturation protease [Anaerolineae bacterium]